MQDPNYSFGRGRQLSATNTTIPEDLVVQTPITSPETEQNNTDDVDNKEVKTTEDKDLLSDSFWNKIDTTDDFFTEKNTTDQHMAHAGKIVNATEAERLMKEGEHVFVNMADVPKIEKYIHSLAN